MRNNETHFEQVPIEIVESIIQQDAALGRISRKSYALVPVPERQALRKFPKPKKNIPSKG